jgi:C_GCAxxG_C_C family probable redox protein
MESKEELAVQIKREGNNCAQAVAKALRKENDPDPQTLQKLASGFGAGMGCLEATCGALVGAVMMAGLHTSGKQPAAITARSILQKFKESSGSVVCKDLKAVKDGIPLCACEDCVRHAVRAYEEVMAEDALGKTPAIQPKAQA